jgi:2-polyprenyl-3-methyl-5-hydroxy-6-metoxy-1,4-benzoquinol methylase
MNQAINKHPASFRDPSGFIYEKENRIYRFVSTTYQQDYQLLQTSNLAAELIKKELLLPFTELQENHTGSENWLITLQPQPLPFISYAWEWSFEQLKDAALATLQICRDSLQKGMILKDATHFNIQFVNGKPKLIDTLSFEQYKTGSPWVAYRQFCECFLNPLLLAAYCNMEIDKLMLSYADGVPAKFTASLLPFKKRWNISVYLHVFLQSKLAGKKDSAAKPAERIISQQKLDQLLQNLEDCIRKLTRKKQVTTWNNYYDETILSNHYLSAKKEMISSLLKEMNYDSVIDLGANEGEFSKLCKQEALVVAADFDADCISNLYTHLKREKRKNILPLVLDLNYPSPSVGWNNMERMAFFNRSKFDLVFALALIHHLAIGKNISLEQIASLFAQIGKNLIVEFIPKNDPKVQEMLLHRIDLFAAYTQENFEAVFGSFFTLQKKLPVPGSERIIYYYQKIL